LKSNDSDKKPEDRKKHIEYGKKLTATRNV